jgi:hypothetical protein
MTLAGKEISVANHHKWIHEKAEIVFDARKEEYLRRMNTTPEKIFKDIFYGFLGEQAFYDLVKKHHPELEISNPDFGFHKNNKHGPDFKMMTKEMRVLTVSIKTCVKKTVEESTWVYQTDRLRLDEDVHVFMTGRYPSGSKGNHPDVFCFVNRIPAKKIFGLLKPMNRPAYGKEAIYYKDVK